MLKDIKDKLTKYFSKGKKLTKYFSKGKKTQLLSLGLVLIVVLTAMIFSLRKTITVNIDGKVGS